ncbi:MAG TPA: hypothetical protein DDW53_07335 [Lachnoclostridium sp.]|uniref:hypothetical protein n=1 Tax=Lacrimispora xylanisolvens TaxID=384636 RepID=UPI000E9430EC|nr:hypothetical protein [uncultured Clostridium sp.]HBE85290.1 hypothetical protein [Lachnoclostridium sp.]
MIVEFFINMFVAFLDTLISTVSMVTLPIDMISALSTVSAYGSWIVGSDLLLLFATCVFTWTTIKIGIGLVLFVWRLLPFT